MSETVSKLVRVYRHRKKWSKPFKFPTVKKVVPTTISQQIVSVQPMTLPSGLLFYLDYQYGSGSQDKE